MESLSPGSKIGPYEIVAPLRSGGMAALYLGRRAGPAGFSKPVAIKVIHPHLAEDSDFVQMFLDEARLAARISDPHVVAVEALGEADGMFYLAMEYVLGASLSQLTRRIREGSRRLAPQVACAIAMRVANGLHAAHELKDEDGAPLGVVHRDVSPQNVLISRTGHVKVIDFGVALSRSHLRETEGGSLKGKLAYMSPEQAWGKPIDRRADVFALGVVLWEMLALRSLFGGGTDIERLERVRNPGMIPSPSLLAPDIDRAVDAVVLQALQVDLDARYESAQAFREALADACPDALRVQAEDLASLVETYTGEQVAKELSALTDVPSDWTGRRPPPAEAKTIAQRLTRESVPMDQQPSDEELATMAARPSSIAPTNPGRAEPSPPPEERTSDAPRSRVLRTLAVAIPVIASAVGVIVGLSAFQEPDAATPATAPAPVASAAAAPDTGCARARRVTGAVGETTSVRVDTRELGTEFALEGVRNPDVPPAPQEILEYVVPEGERFSLALSTATTGTDPRFDTMLAVFRGACSEPMLEGTPDVAFDDFGREFRAAGRIAVEGGETVTVLVFGWGGELAHRTDRGLAQLDLALRPSSLPELAEATAVLAGTQLHVTTEARDADGDVVGLEVRLLDERGEALELSQVDDDVVGMEPPIIPHERAGVLRGGFARSVEGSRRFEERAVLWIHPQHLEQLAAARRAEVRLVDASAQSSEARTIELRRAAVVGPGEACGEERTCAEELRCGPERTCVADVDRSAVCRDAPVIELEPGEGSAMHARVAGSIRAGPGHFLGQCLRRWTGGREEVYRLTVPEGRWDIELTTDTDGVGAVLTEPDTVVYVRRDCLDTRESSAHRDWCNDDIIVGEGPEANWRSTVSLSGVEAGALTVFVELWGSALPSSEERYELDVTLTPARE